MAGNDRAYYILMAACLVTIPVYVWIGTFTHGPDPLFMMLFMILLFGATAVSLVQDRRKRTMREAAKAVSPSGIRGSHGREIGWDVRIPLFSEVMREGLWRGAVIRLAVILIGCVVLMSALWEIIGLPSSFSGWSRYLFVFFLLITVVVILILYVRKSTGDAFTLSYLIDDTGILYAISGDRISSGFLFLVGGNGWNFLGIPEESRYRMRWDEIVSTTTRDEFHVILLYRGIRGPLPARLGHPFPVVCDPANYREVSAYIQDHLPLMT